VAIVGRARARARTKSLQGSLLFPGAAALICGAFNRCRLMQTAASEAVRSPRFPRSLLVIAVATGILLGGTLVLWAQYGAAVFFDMIAAGIAWCL
jgi:hypothetical protein